MDIFSYSRQPSSNYKSPRLHNQVSDLNLRSEENDPRKLLQISAGTTLSANKLFQAIIKEVGSLSKDQTTPSGSTTKVFKSLVNRTHLQDSNKKAEKQNKTLQANKSRDFEPINLFPDNTNGRDYDGDYTADQGQKLPTINNKKQLPKVDTRRLEKFNGLDKYIQGQSTSKAGEADMYVTQQSANNRFATQTNNSSPLKQQKETWRSPTKLTNDEREYKGSKGQENGNIISPNVGMRTRYSSGGLKFFQNTLSGEEEEGNTDSIGFSLMISPVKGSQRVGKHLKKNTEVSRQPRVVSPESKDKSVDFAELRKVKMKIEQQNPKVNQNKKKYQNKASSSVFQIENVRHEEEKNMEGWYQNESEGSDGKDFEDEEEVEVEERKREKKTEKDKNKERQVYLGLRKGSAQPAIKETKFEPTVNMVSKQNKRLQDHIQISRIGDKEKESVQLKREHAYKEFMLRMNFSFNVQVKVPTEKTFTAYKYFLGKGNNSILIKSLMKQRWWWVQVDNKDAGDVNFMWTQLKQNKFIEGLKQKRKSPFDNLEWSGLSSSHCNNGNDTTATTASFIDSMTDCESDTTEGETKTTTKKSRNSQVLKNSGKAAIKKEISDSAGRTQEETIPAAYKKLFTNQEIMLMNSMNEGKLNAPLYPEDCEEMGRLRRGPSPQVIVDPSVMKMCNHLESNYHLANKKALLWNMKSYYEAIKQNVFDYLPLTFHVRNGFEDKEYQKFVEYYNNREKEIQEQEKLAQESKEAKKIAKKLRNIWIVKPGENTNRGVGIHVCDTLSQINDIVGTTQGNTDGKKRTYLIQQYLDKPLLYNKRKFDIRCYILMTCINGMMKGYWYQDGYIRTASKEFSLKNVTNKFIHLTNDAVQKKAEEYGKFESGNKLSYTEFQKYLDTHHDGTINFATDIYPQIKQLATDAIKGVYGKIDPYRRENSFEIFGLDFMIDTSLRAWLIEVNTNPDINASSPALTRVIPPMVENALRLTIDQMYPPPAWQTSKKQMLPENLLENNKFELVFDEVEDGPALRSILQADKGATGDLILEIVAEEEEEDAEEEAKD